jgi:hypothetical protein
MDVGHPLESLSDSLYKDPLFYLFLLFVKQLVLLESRMAVPANDIFELLMPVSQTMVCLLVLGKHSVILCGVEHNLFDIILIDWMERYLLKDAHGLVTSTCDYAPKQPYRGIVATTNVNSPHDFEVSVR